MKLDVAALRYLDRDDFRVLTAVEMGMKNHELVPVELITQIASLRLGGVHKILSTLLRCKLLHHDRQSFDGYRLTYMGYDYLALRAFLARDSVAGVGRQIGVGKESDIFTVVNEEGEEMCLKMHRLGRTSFRAIKNKRDYHSKRGSPSWLYLSRLAALKENTFMKVLHEHDFPVPTPIDSSRHAIVMSLVDGFPLNQVRELDQPEPVYVQMMELIERFARYGLIHGDFNEFNVMINNTGKLTVIDFPQMVSINHPNARMYFERDVNCVRRFFRKRFNFFMEYKPDFAECLANRENDLDRVVAASGFTYQMAKEFDRFVEHVAEASDGGSDDDDDDDDDGASEGSENEGEEEDGGEPPAAKVVEAAVEGDAASSPQAPTAAGESGTPVAAAKEQDTGDDGVASDAAQNSAAEEDNDDAAQNSGAEEDNDDAASLGDGPGAYLAHDFARGPAMQPRVDDIRRRVKRDLSRKSKMHQRKGKSTRNTVKSRTKRQLKAEVADY